MNPDKITFSVERSCGDDHPSIHLYFGGNVRIRVGDTLESLHYLIHKLGNMAAEIEECHRHELQD